MTLTFVLKTGEAPGFTSVLDACSPSQQPVARHILISEAPISLSAQDREYLQYKGVFTLPQKSTCNELLRAYFHHVHPMMPIVDATVLLKFHETGKASEWNLLLLWSMFFVAANVSHSISWFTWFIYPVGDPPANSHSQFVDARVWTLEGYSSRKEMKAAMYSRAKVRTQYWSLRIRNNSHTRLSACTTMAVRRTKSSSCNRLSSWDSGTQNGTDTRSRGIG